MVLLGTGKSMPGQATTHWLPLYHIILVRQVWLGVVDICPIRRTNFHMLSVDVHYGIPKPERFQLRFPFDRTAAVTNKRKQEKLNPQSTCIFLNHLVIQCSSAWSLGVGLVWPRTVADPLFYTTRVIIPDKILIRLSCPGGCHWPPYWHVHDQRSGDVAPTTFWEFSLRWWRALQS